MNKTRFHRLISCHGPFMAFSGLGVHTHTSKDVHGKKTPVKRYGTMLFTSVYSVVDGYFVSNFIGKTSFAAITLIFPLLSILGAAGFMFGEGGSALVGKRLGEGKRTDACQIFSLLTITTFLLGCALALMATCIISDVARLLGATGETLEQSVLYGRISLLSLPAFMLQFFFMAFFVTAEKPELGFAVTVLAGVTSIILDAVFILVLHRGLVGAAVATVISEYVGGFTPLIYFLCKRSGLLTLGMPKKSIRPILRAAANGASEFLTNIAFPFVMTLYTMQLLALAGENGVASFGVLLYVSFVFSSVFFGYAMGSIPLVSYNFGARRWGELNNIFFKSILINGVAGSVLTLTDYAAAKPIAYLFTGYDEELYELTVRALTLYAPVFLLSCINIFAASFFTGMNNALISTTLSCLRSLVFGIAAVLILPHFLGIDGIWIAWSCTELCTLFCTAFFFQRMHAEYLSPTKR